jgi:uncharacterized damage-inducible protein DinB
MDTREYIQRQLAMGRRIFDGIVGDLTEEQASWSPPGTANSIKHTLLHLVSAEDNFVQRTLQGLPLVAVRDGWAEQLDVPDAPKPDWERVRRAEATLEQLLAYERAVRAATERYVAELTADALEQTVVISGQERPAYHALMILSVHLFTHAGEIAALKGMQGAVGLGF